MPRSIIAMKGHPFTKKTEFATLIAAYMRCLVLSLDDFLESLCPDSLQTSPSSNNATPPLPQPQDLALQIICQIAKSHLSARLLENIVIDSPLSSRSHLDQLIELALSLVDTRLVIVECKPKNVYEWQTKFQEYIDQNPDHTQKWYKAKNRSDIEKAIQEDYDETLDGYKVSKLVLDPLLDYQKKFSIRHMLIFRSVDSPPSFLEAVKYMITREEDDNTDYIVSYDTWRQSQQLLSSSLNREEDDDHGSCTDGHNITNYAEEGLGNEANCTACGKQVTGAVYTCKGCSLALHKECAESFDSSGNPPPNLMYYWYHFRYPEKFPCAICKEDGKSFSEDCLSCLFQTHFRCHLVPTIIRHDCEKHFLSIELPPLRTQSEVYQCGACGESGDYSFYSCKICGAAYHYECLTELPRRVEHVHGGHHHHMLLKFSSTEEAEDYICNVCVEYGKPFTRNPELWFYSCEECPYEAHVYCIVELC